VASSAQSRRPPTGMGWADRVVLAARKTPPGQWTLQAALVVVGGLVGSWSIAG
jgi:hypothetical protein